METEVDYISIYDSTASAKLVYVSESVYDVLGFTPQEIIGLGAYELTHPNERAALSVLHSSNLTNEPMSSLCVYKSRHKDGHYVTCDIIVHPCYDVFICTNFARSSCDTVKASMRTTSADESYVIGEDGSIEITSSWRNRQERIKTLFSTPFRDFSKPLEGEPRFCLIINRYTEAATIVFASRYCYDLVGIGQTQLIGSSLFDFVAKKDRVSVSTQLDLTKEQSIIARFRFKWLHGSKEIPVETCISGTYDGLVMVVRLATTGITFVPSSASAASDHDVGG
jgi:PAS domain S-box-containing protein